MLFRSVHIEWDDNYIHMSVSDDGPGFTSSILARAGQPWNSSRAGQSGHRGLGLFIARTLIDSMGGAVSFANGTAGGALVSLKIPLSALE